jgi:hypothetical protein
MLTKPYPSLPCLAWIFWVDFNFILLNIVQTIPGYVKPNRIVFTCVASQLTNSF